jgi:hypothetical protein
MRMSPARQRYLVGFFRSLRGEAGGSSNSETSMRKAAAIDSIARSVGFARPFSMRLIEACSIPASSDSRS